MFFSRFKVVFAVTSGIIFVSVVFLIFNFDGSHDIIWLNVFVLVHTIIIFIFITRYYFCQNPNFKLYLSFYHHQPSPVLPWQLPSDFDPNSVILKYVLYENEQNKYGCLNILVFCSRMLTTLISHYCSLVGQWASSNFKQAHILWSDFVFSI